jgi:NAD(P)-dependent dehydrogenase (short-subunit alcohol dehydrogenase family)
MKSSVARKFFAGRKVLITGGSSGIGKALAFSLAEAGAEVSVVGKTQQGVDGAIDEFARSGLRVTSWACDLASEAATWQLAEDVVAQAGPPDILINNAGFATYRAFAQLEPAEISSLMAVNLLAPIRLTRGFVPHFLARGSGVIVNMSSIAGRIPLTPNMIYTTAKHGLVAWSECLRFELAGSGIQVNVICPGRVITPFFDHETFRVREQPREARHTVPLSLVVDRTLQAIIQNRFMTYIPRSFGFLAWTTNAFSALVHPAYAHIMRKRLQSMPRTACK